MDGDSAKCECESHIYKGEACQSMCPGSDTDSLIVCAGLSSVNVGKTRQGGVSFGLKLEDNSYAMWANSYGDSLAASLNLDVGRFNVLAHSGELRSHIEAMFPGLKR